MTDSDLYFASPFESTPEYSENNNDTPIRMLQTYEDNFVHIEARKLFEEDSTKVNKRKEVSNEGLQTNIGGSIKTAIRINRNSSSPIESISNFSPHTIEESEGNASPRFCNENEKENKRQMNMKRDGSFFKGNFG